MAKLMSLVKSRELRAKSTGGVRVRKFRTKPYSSDPKKKGFWEGLAVLP